jgi:hypothetical protein
VICVVRMIAAIALLCASCYDDPNYTATRFKCDPTHGCPAGQQCVGGQCTPQGADAAIPTTDAAGAKADGVVCGAAICTAQQQCCAEFAGQPSCTPIGAACTGVAATCDGLEDCNGGACCFDLGRATVACAASCAQLPQVCRDAADCTDPMSRLCCLGSEPPGAPWGICRPICPP